MMHRTNRDLIDFLREEIARGEYSLGTHIEIVGRLKATHPKLSEQFDGAYTTYANEDYGVSPEIAEQVYEALGSIEEPEKPKDLMDLIS